MSEMATNPAGEIRIISVASNGMIKSVMVAGNDWLIRYFTNREALEAAARAYDMTIVEKSDDESDNGP